MSRRLLTPRSLAAACAVLLVAALAYLFPGCRTGTGGGGMAVVYVAQNYVAFQKDVPFFLSVEVTGIGNAATFTCTYYANGSTSSGGTSWTVGNPASVGKPLQVDGADRVMLTVKPPLGTSDPVGSSPTPNGPIGSGIIVVQGRTLAGALVGEARFRVWRKL